MKKSRRRVIWVVVIVLLLVAGVIGGIVYFLPEPPTAVMEATRVALTEAKDKKADLYNKKLYKQALTLYDSAMVAWKRENARWFLFRDFAQVTSFAAEARIKADLAGRRSEDDERGAKVRLEKGVLALQDKAKVFDRYFLNIPMSAAIKSKHAKGKLTLNEAIVAVSRENYKEGEEKFNVAKRNIGEAYESAERVMKEYFKSLPKWQKQLEQTLADSRKNDRYVLVVEKFPARCRLYYNGVLKEDFQAEFGKNWLGDKRCEGDYATPEGIYRVIKKLSSGSTRYHKALLLDYPNAEDREEFGRLKRSGAISRSARIGNLIEVHGDGGKGGHWTNGCVALRDGEMDKVFKFASVGMMVTIIGAAQPWDKIIEEYKNYGTKHE